MSLRLFVVGLPKAGTSTIHQAMEKAHFTSAHWCIDHRGQRLFVGDLLEKEFAAGNDPMADIRATCITQADACIPSMGVNTWPQMNLPLLLRLRELHPSAVFLLNRRDVDSHAASIDGWRDMRQRFAQSDIPGLPRGRGKKDSELRGWIEWHHDRMREFFAGDPRFVDVDIADPEAPTVIGKALGVTLSWWGRANTGSRKGAAK